MVLIADDLGVWFDRAERVERVVSLVPSLTESIAVSRWDALIAVTQWCTRPVDLDVERVRGTKNPDVGRIIELRPDLVVANQEENRKMDVDRLRAAGIPVWVTVVKTVPGALAGLQRMFTVALGWPAPEWLVRCRALWRRQAPIARRRVAIPIWRDPWMVVGSDTFAGDLAARLGLVNVFNRHSGRYPHVTVGEILDMHPELVVLPDEPYPFTADDGPEAFGATRCVLVEGRALTWYGPALLESPQTLGTAIGSAAGGLMRETGSP